MSKKFVALLLSGLVGVAVGSPEQSFTSSSQSFLPSSSNSNVITVESRAVGAVTTLGGTVVPLREVTLAAQLPGRVVFLRGGEGDWFEDRQVLAALDDADLLAQRRAAIADAANAEFAVRNARVQFSNQLYSGRSVSPNTDMGMGMPSMFDKMFTRPLSGMTGMSNPYVERGAEVYGARTGVEQAEAALAGAHARIEGIDAKLRDTRSIAPFAGVIVQKFAEVGDTIQPGQPILKVADTRNLQIRVEVPARLMPGLRKGMIVSAKLDVGNTRLDSRVAQIYPMADTQRHTVTVKLDLPQGSPAGPGMYAEVQIPDISASNNVLPVVPISAVIWRGNLPAVFVVGTDNKSELRMVRVGERVGNSYSILSGLNIGEHILVSPTPGVAGGWGGGNSE
jgi:multidrug efflux pump subunit AcrA (membrane-fusion protein)